jgi:hypothetical protein
VRECEDVRVDVNITVMGEIERKKQSATESQSK